jgi:hypothetical protein
MRVLTRFQRIEDEQRALNPTKPWTPESTRAFTGAGIAAEGVRGRKQASQAIVAVALLAGCPAPSDRPVPSPVTRPRRGIAGERP